MYSYHIKEKRTNEPKSKFADTAIPLLKEELIKQGASKKSYCISCWWKSDV